MSQPQLVNDPHSSRFVFGPSDVDLAFLQMVLSGVTVLCSSGMKSVYSLKEFVKLFYFTLFLWFPEAHWCTVQWGLVVCHEKEHADILWSDFYFQMIVLLKTIHIIYIYI